MAREKREMKDSNKKRQSNIYESTHSSHRQERERVWGAVKVFDRCNGVRLRSSGCVADSLEQREQVWYDNAPRASSVRHMPILSLGRSVQMVGLTANKGNRAGWEKRRRDAWCNTNDKPTDNTFSLVQQGQLVQASSKRKKKLVLLTTGWIPPWFLNLQRECATAVLWANCMFKANTYWRYTVKND